MKDGWHIVSGYNVYVENDKIKRGVSRDSRTIYVYRVSKNGGYDKEEEITVIAFRSGVKRGTIRML